LSSPGTIAPRVEALFAEGNQHMAEGDAAAAQRCFEAALAWAPDVPELHANLALLLDQIGQDEAAERHYRTALAHRPDLPEVHLNLGALLARQKRFGGAEASLSLALRLRPHDAASWTNLGVLYAALQRDAAAEACHRRALALAPDLHKAAFNLAYVLLRQARWDEGWPALEGRASYAPLAAHLAAVPRWQGEPLRGRSLLLGFEAGQGDMVMACRYVAVLRALGAGPITLLCHPSLKRLCTSLLQPPADEVIAFDEPVPTEGWDLWAPMLSLPGLCGTTSSAVPADLPYLQVPADWALAAQAWLTAAWPVHTPPGALPQQPASRPLRVGLVWRGNPAFENDADRSLPDLRCLAPLGAAVRQAGCAVQFISLQKGAGEADALAPPAELHGLLVPTAWLDDFVGTAALVAQLDLVISVDTAVAHLAGALGRPCWLLLPDYKCDWRWLTGRTDTPWYPAVMRLFRQARLGEAGGRWEPLIEQLASELVRWAASHPAHVPDGLDEA
jgi:lipoprotein NlpI